MKNSEFNYLTRKNSEGCTRCRYPPAWQRRQSYIVTNMISHF